LNFKAFCYLDDLLSRVLVTYPQGSAALQGAVGQVAIHLFPRNDSNRDRCDDDDTMLL
jgi:hypothetical protein